MPNVNENNTTAADATPPQEVLQRQASTLTVPTITITEQTTELSVENQTLRSPCRSTAALWPQPKENLDNDKSALAKFGFPPKRIDQFNLQIDEAAIVKILTRLHENSDTTTIFRLTHGLIHWQNPLKFHLFIACLIDDTRFFTASLGSNAKLNEWLDVAAACGAKKIFATLLKSNDFDPTDITTTTLLFAASSGESSMVFEILSRLDDDCYNHEALITHAKKSGDQKLVNKLIYFLDTQETPDTISHQLKPS
jgi:hypothetical protein